MIANPFRYLWRNWETILLAFILAVAVWISAVLASDPNEEKALLESVPLQVVGQPEDLAILGDLPASVEVRLLAPQSVWNEIEADIQMVQAKVNLTGLEPGNYELEVEVDPGVSPVQVTEVVPGNVRFTLEPLVAKEMEIKKDLVGEPARGFLADEPVMDAESTLVSGPQSLVNLVDQVRAVIGISGVRETVSSEIQLVAVDETGQVISGVSFSPETVMVSVAVTQAGEYKDVAVKVETVGLPATGFRVTNISASPPTVTLFSPDPELVADLPGFVSTQPIDLTEASDDIEIRLALDLVEGVSVVGDEQTVTVQIGVTAIETGISLTVPIEIVGLGAGLGAEISPDSVDVFLTGPLSVIEGLLPEDVLVTVNLTDLGEGAHLVTPQVEILAEKVEAEAVNPDTIEVVIIIIDSTGDGQTPTPSPAANP